MSLLPFHVAMMSIAFVSMSAAISIAHWGKKAKWWLKAHKTLNIVAVSALLAGFALAVGMVQTSGGPHFRVDHAVIGSMTVLLSLCVIFLGFSIFRSKDKAKTASLRVAHRWSGRAVLLMMIFSIVEGLDLAGII